VSSSHAASPRAKPPSQAKSPRQKVRLVAFAFLLGLVLVSVAVVAVKALEASLKADPVAASETDPSEGSSDELASLPELPPQVSDPSAPLPARILQRTIVYAALGDSYSAGPGLSPQRPDPVSCQRSGYNWPAYVADWLDVATYFDVTCTGATTQALLRGQPRPSGPLVPPQAGVLSSDTDLVTVSLGGNDNALFATLVGTCPELAVDDPDGSPCRTAYTDNGDDDRVLGQVPGRLAVVIRRIRLAAPSAQVVVIGYPQIFPREGTCDAISLATGDVAWAAGLVDRLNAVIEKAARSEGVRFVDVAGESAEHDICSADPWVTGAQGEPEAAAPWHPFPAGMRGVARLVTAQGPPNLDKGVARANADS
jgi:lysophospholipase L1-like esterase